MDKTTVEFVTKEYVNKDFIHKSKTFYRKTTTHNDGTITVEWEPVDLWED